MDTIIAIAEAIKAFFGFATKVVPSDAIRDDNHLIKKPRLQEREKIAIYDREFRRLKDHTEIAIPLDLQFVDDNLNEDDQKELTELLTARIIQYRKANAWARPKFKKWLKDNNLI